MATLTLTLEELLQALAQSPPATLVEALSAHQFAAGHLPGALNLPRAWVTERAGEVLPDPDAVIVVYCRDERCQASVEVAAMLVGLGYTRVCEFPAGKEGWRASGRALVTDDRSEDSRAPPTASGSPASVARRPAGRRR